MEAFDLSQLNLVLPRAAEQIQTMQNSRPAANCWGTTRYCTGAQEQHVFAGEYEVVSWLETNTQMIPGSELRVGDVVALWRDTPGGDRSIYTIVHTALYVGGGLWWHQRGWYGPMLLESLDQVTDHYSDIYRLNTTFHRPTNLSTGIY